jgi:hypothetical protein
MALRGQETEMSVSSPVDESADGSNLRAGSGATRAKGRDALAEDCKALTRQEETAPPRLRAASSMCGLVGFGSGTFAIGRPAASTWMRRATTASRA